jgi:hypothetical protein
MKAGGVGKSALTSTVLECINYPLLMSLFPVRFIRDVFVENYDPTIEGQWFKFVHSCDDCVPCF